MAYLELSKEAYNDIINAAGMKGSKVARVCETQGVWSAEAAAEEPVVVEERAPRTTYAAVPEVTSVATPEAEEGDQLEDWDREEAEMKKDDPIVDASDD